MFVDKFARKILAARWQVACLLLLIIILSQWRFESPEAKSAAVLGAEDVSFSIYKSTDFVSPTKAARQQDFQALIQGYFNLGANNFALIKMNINSQDKSKLAGTWISINRNKSSWPVFLYYADGSVWHSRQFSYISDDGRHLQIELPAESGVTSLYLAVRGKYQRGVVTIGQPQGYINKLRASSMLSGIYYGVILLALVLSLLLYRQNKHKVFLGYALLLMSMPLWLLAGEGWLNRFVLADRPFWFATCVVGVGQDPVTRCGGQHEFRFFTPAGS